MRRTLCLSDDLPERIHRNYLRIVRRKRSLRDAVSLLPEKLSGLAEVKTYHLLCGKLKRYRNESDFLRALAEHLPAVLYRISADLRKVLPAVGEAEYHPGAALRVACLEHLIRLAAVVEEHAVAGCATDLVPGELGRPVPAGYPEILRCL